MVQGAYDPEDSIDSWTLTPEDHVRIAGKSRDNRLAFAVLLLFFGEHFKPGARKSRGVVHLIGWPRNGTRFSARSLLCPRLDLGDPPDALAALSRTIRKHPGRSSRPLADRLRLDGLPSPSLSHPQEGLRRATPWRARLPRCTRNQAGGPALSHQ